MVSTNELSKFIEMYDYDGEMQQDEGDGVNALNLQWVLGFNKDIDQGVHNLTTD